MGHAFQREAYLRARIIFVTTVLSFKCMFSVGVMMEGLKDMYVQQRNRIFFTGRHEFFSEAMPRVQVIALIGWRSKLTL